MSLDLNELSTQTYVIIRLKSHAKLIDSEIAYIIYQLKLQRDYQLLTTCALGMHHKISNE